MHEDIQQKTDILLIYDDFKHGLAVCDQVILLDNFY